ncbi:AmpG family muropeptide MFS transporter [Haematospirillum jordaniae]|uniref:AmpG family muropeptide MFS transporter n=1 Tax=Haematospirillum jordaniae TaxID=1549855 RepID=UPI00143290CC|nr:AmpG family muropeptide MFS transporter [Haematospirillum jordaniae]NKD86629.1 AmpG family muropeptide MFS transporter [Haematospirillum jordaniae]
MQNWWRSVAVYGDRRVMIILVQGFASGLPLPLVYATLSAWLTEASLSKTAIGLFSWASTVYALKFLWSPVVDHIRIPLLTSWLGRRKSWMLVSQIALIVAMTGLGSSDPATYLWGTAAWTVALAFASATQDIVIDAYRIESLEQDMAGAGAGGTVLGYRIGMMASGAGALILADAFGWQVAYASMAALMAGCFLFTLFVPEPESPQGRMRQERHVTQNSDWLYDTIIAPFADFIRRENWVLILLFIAFYKYGDALLGVMANPFYIDIGFTKTDIGVVSKTYGVVMTIAGGLIGGAIVLRYGIMRALLLCGILQAASNLVFVAQAIIGPSVPALVVTISVENLTGGMGSAAFVAYLSSLTNVAYTATQYALVSSFMAFARTFMASGGGWLADHVAWSTYFMISTLAAIPGLVLLLWMMKAFPRQNSQIHVSAMADD